MTHTETNMAWHELDIYYGGRDPEETLQKCQKLVHNDGFPSFKYCIIAKIL